ncbi:hypothetical protein [Leptolyngbya ohadii]|uniref:hypothetical protein n=1 Tax=Leptolyngbya ohadii TaxID=1962290 RepID=UPI000B59AE46|nr:hypothetical protein [Leptolyngbya ohadii]
MLEQNIDARQQALQFLIANFVAQGHPAEYAQHMATATIFQADLELRNAQMVSLLGWLQQSHSEVYQEAIALLETTREQFEKRVHQ